MYGDNNDYRNNDMNNENQPRDGSYDGTSQSGHYEGYDHQQENSYDATSQGGRYSGNRFGRDGSYGGYGNYSIPPRHDMGNRIPPTVERPAKKPGFFLKAVSAIALGLFFGAFAAAGFYGSRALMENTGLLNSNQKSSIQESAVPAQSAQTVPAITNSTAPVTRYSTVGTDISDVVQGAMPAMVAITNNFTEKQNFFGRTFESEGQAGGSGIIVGENDSEYLIVTNQHVISNANNLLVKFIDGEEVNALIKGYDQDQDIAVIAVSKSDIKPETAGAISIAALGDSAALTLGEPTIAIGNALGYGQSVTTGVVSALDREIENDGKETFIQTDAAINPGNSGGALLNINGEVIGINSNKLGGSIVEGMGYAIPISRVKPLIEDFMTRPTKGAKTAQGKQAYLGITGVDVTSDVANTYNMPVGVYIAQVHEGGAAATAGVTDGDIITKFDGSSVKSMVELQEALSYYEAGSQVDIVIQRGTPGGYEEKTLTVILGNREDMKEQ